MEWAFDEESEEGSIRSDFQTTERTWQMRKRVDRLLRWLRSCARCGSILPPIDILCAGCREMLLEQQNCGSALLQSEYAFPVYALFTWTPANDDLIRPFVYAFKRGYCAGFAAELMLRMIHEIGVEVPMAPNFVYPGAHRPDHAWLLARSAAETMGRNGEALMGLRPAAGSVQSQKNRSASQRRSRRFLTEKKLSGQGRSWVFVDDVITTGSTAEAARKALGDRERFEAWALVCRPKLARMRGFW